MLLMLIVAFTTYATPGIQGCEHEKILACAVGLQEELSTTRLIVNINQLKTYCDKMAAAHNCILNQSNTCQSDVRSSYAHVVKAEQSVIRDLCRKGPFQDDYLREAGCLSRIYSEQNNGVCSKDYVNLVAHAFGSRSREKMHNPTTLHNMCCAYYAVFKCTQTHAGRCGGRTMTKSPLRQIYQGLDHNCRPFKAVCEKSKGTPGSGGATGGGGGNTYHKPKILPHHPPAGKNRGHSGSSSSGVARSFSLRKTAPTARLLLAVAVVVTLVSAVISSAATP
ncbi:uncharacterized protein LOC114828231 [Galendromus occidentalis]|uniref:Uncharacterized protein LOC114828231 n=1 Tax=Galendromus occidentalis TaxID=34638 RepID=A0AAJ7WHJ0_9ACAR|nr:uncharacterized protein LOC114828231 [Galendromus occidentalis]